jgi:hypothetical protein
MIRVQDTEMFGAADPDVLEWAAQQGRLLLTHDVETMTEYAAERIRAGLPMSGVIFVHNDLPIGKVIEDILTILGASDASEWESKMRFLPL